MPKSTTEKSCTSHIKLTKPQRKVINRTAHLRTILLFSHLQYSNAYMANKQLLTVKLKSQLILGKSFDAAMSLITDEPIKKYELAKKININLQKIRAEILSKT